MLLPFYLPTHPRKKDICYVCSLLFSNMDMECRNSRVAFTHHLGVKGWRMHIICGPHHCHLWSSPLPPLVLTITTFGPPLPPLVLTIAIFGPPLPHLVLHCHLWSSPLPPLVLHCHLWSSPLPPLVLTIATLAIRQMMYCWLLLMEHNLYRSKYHLQWLVVERKW